jgi:NAD(P)-dependent dehydrogenase (short-subunit alcohol dehydrogenase family)
LLDAGACVLIAGAEREPLDAWQAEAAAQELELETFEADPEDDLDARDALRAATSRFGGVDIVVLDADAIGSRGTEHMLAEALKLLREQSTGGGVIALAREVDVASACNAAAREGADANIRVNRVVLGEPGSGLLGMPVTPAHVGRVVTFLAEARAPITGATLSIGD